jgi:hypothetical protein
MIMAKENVKKDRMKGLGEERKWAEENQANSHSGEHYAVSCFCLTLIAPSLLSSGNRK